MFKNVGMIGRLFGIKQITVPPAEELELFNYMPLGRVYKLVNIIVAAKRREEDIAVIEPFSLSYSGAIIHHGSNSTLFSNVSSDDRLLCVIGKIVWGFKDRSYIGGSMQTYPVLSLPRDYYRVMDLELNIVEALQCTLDNARQKYNNNIALLEIPEFSLKGCKISGM